MSRHHPHPVPAGTPAEVAPYVRAVGVDQAVEVVLAFGGAPLYFARNASSRSTVAKIVGTKGVEALERELGAGTLRVPLVKAWVARHLKDAHGMSAQAIARKLHTTDVTVRSYLKGASAPGQLNLFD